MGAAPRAFSRRPARGSGSATSWAGPSELFSWMSIVWKISAASNGILAKTRPFAQRTPAAERLAAIGWRGYYERSMSIPARVSRHVRLSRLALSRGKRQTPPFMIVFMNSICNLTCEHCFYWRNLNKRDDLTYDEHRKLSLELGSFENLNLSGGEPFIRQDFAKICKLYIDNNGVKQIYVPTSGFFTDRTEVQLREVLESPTLKLFVCEISLDGMPEYHNRFRGSPESFDRAMATYERLAALQKEDP